MRIVVVLSLLMLVLGGCAPAIDAWHIRDGPTVEKQRSRDWNECWIEGNDLILDSTLRWVPLVSGFYIQSKQEEIQYHTYKCMERKGYERRWR